jgi:hypothetical protein
MSDTAKLYATTHIDQSKGWQATRRVTGHFVQHRVHGPFTWRVETTWGNGDVTHAYGEFHDETDARRYAWSMCNGDRSKPARCEPYYFSFDTGRVAPDRVHPLCEANARDWSVRPAGMVALAWDPEPASVGG